MGPENDMTADIREGIADIAATVVKVDVAKRRSSNLAPAQADIAEQENRQVPGSGIGGPT